MIRALRSVLVFACLSQAAYAAITYVDATPANTMVQGNYTSGADEGAMDNLWHFKSAAGNGASVWTADEAASGIEDVAPLITTVTLPSTGGFRIFAYIWNPDGAGEDWDARVRLAHTYSTVQASEAAPADSAHFSASVLTAESGRRLIQIPLGVVVTPPGGTVQVYVDDDATVGSRRTWFDGVGYERVFGALGERIIAVDCNKTNATTAPSQALFRSLGGSSTTSQNSTNIIKNIGPYALHISKSSSTRFDFRGANGDATRVIPGGPTSLSFLAADFLGARDGTIDVTISNLAAGAYLFRSYHLDTVTSANLGFAQGSSPTNQNTLRAHIAGSLQGIIQPTAIGTLGVGTNFVSDTDIPTLALAFDADGVNPVRINLSTLYANGPDRFIFVNGFEIFSTTP